MSFMPLLLSAQSRTDISQVNARSAVLSGHLEKAIEIYAQLVEKNLTSKSKYSTVNTTLLSEYAYSLALGKVYDGALMNLERVILLGNISNETLFYISQVFALMEYDTLANTFWTLAKGNPPKWIKDNYKVLHERNKTPGVINQDDFPQALKRANDLAAQNFFLQAIVIFQELTDNYPDQPLAFIGYSALWEHLGYPVKAAEVLQQGIAAMGVNKSKNDPKNIYSKHLLELQSKSDKSKLNSLSGEGVKSLKRPQMVVYAGGMFAESYLSFNSRFGLYTLKNNNVSIELGVSNYGETTSFNIGASYYATLRWLVIGLGVNQQFTKDVSTFSVKPSIGISIPSKSGRSSFDMLINAYIPTVENAKYVYGISIGKSFYF